MRGEDHYSVAFGEEDPQVFRSIQSTENLLHRNSKHPLITGESLTYVQDCR